MQTIIVILGHANDLKGQLSPIAISRLDQGIQVLKDHPESSIVLTGGFGDHFNKTKHAHSFYAKQYLLSKAVPESKIMEPLILSSNTIEDGSQSRELINSLDPDLIYLVTSEFHAPRAEFVFKKNFPDRMIKTIAAVSPISTAELSRLGEHEMKQLAKSVKSRNLNTNMFINIADPRVLAIPIQEFHEVLIDLKDQNILQYRLRKALKENNDSILNQVKKPTDKPSMKWVYRIFTNVMVLNINVNGSSQQVVINVKDRLLKIIRYFGPKAMEIYSVEACKAQ